MQKKDNKGSILIWSIFLVLFMSFSFLVTSRQVSENIKKVGMYTDIVNETLDIPSDLSSKNYYGLLKFKESSEFRSHGTSTLTGRIFLENGGPLEYKTLKINPVTGDGELTSSSGLVFKGNYVDYELDLDSNYVDGVLFLRNIGGLSKFIIQSEYNFLGDSSLLENRDYIGNKVVTNDKIFIKNFDKGYINSNFTIEDFKNKGLYIDN